MCCFYSSKRTKSWLYSRISHFLRRHTVADCQSSKCANSQADLGLSDHKSPLLRLLQHASVPVQILKRKLATEFRCRAEAWIYSVRVQRQRVSCRTSEKRSMCLRDESAIFGCLSSTIWSQKKIRGKGCSAFLESHCYVSITQAAHRVVN